MSVELIAEVANAHQGNVELALELALASVEVGLADSVKFQLYRRGTSPHRTLGILILRNKPFCQGLELHIWDYEETM